MFVKSCFLIFNTHSPLFKSSVYCIALYYGHFVFCCCCVPDAPVTKTNSLNVQTYWAIKTF